MLEVVHLNRHKPSDWSAALGDLNDGSVLDAVEDARREVAQLAHRHLIHGYDRSTRLADVPIALGLMLEPLNDADRAFMKRTLPAPVRLLYPVLIHRPWKKYAATLRNGA